MSDRDAATLKAGAQFSTVAGDISTHAATGSVFGLPQSDAKPLSTQTFNFAFANGGRDVNNFALDLSGSGFDGSSLESSLKSGDGSTIAGTFGGFSAKDGVTMTVSTFSPSINVTGAALTTY